MKMRARKRRVCAIMAPRIKWLAAARRFIMKLQIANVEDYQ